MEAIRTSLMAEFLELLRSGKPAPRKPAPKRKAAAKPKPKSSARRSAKNR